MTMALWFLLAAASPSFSQSTATLKALDLYRSDAVSLADIRAKTDRLVETYVRLRNDGRKTSLKNAEITKQKIESAVKALGDFSFVSMSYNEYVTSAEHTVYVTFDVVDKKDFAQRMPFRVAPTETVEDPAGLSAAWQEYAALGQSLVGRGLISAADRPDCPGFYCLWGSLTPELAALEKRFAGEAVARRAPLKAVFHDDASATKRAGALCVLSYLTDGKEVAGLALEGIRDSSPEVRAAALQILSDLALYHKDIFIDVKDLISALDYPTVSDRSKAMGVLVGLADNPTYKPYVISRGTPRLLGLLKLQQPSNHDMAFTLLSMLSKESFDRRDYASWEAWVAGVSASTGTVPSK